MTFGPCGGHGIPEMPHFLNLALKLNVMKLLLLITFLLTCFGAQGQDDAFDERVVIKEISTDKSYGFKPKKSIKVGSIRNEYTFIAQLTGPNGEEITANRLGSGWAVKSRKAPFGKALLDKWELKYDGLEEPIIIYLNGYDYEAPKCPIGLNFRKNGTAEN